jgi:plastocyanin
MDKTLFFIFGITLVVSAVGIAAIGLRYENFPPNRGVLFGVVMYFAALVGATAVFAVLNARDEQHKEQAEAAAETNATTTTSAPSGGPVQLAADPSTIAFTTTSLQAKAGNVTIDFTNPNQAIPHDVCVQSSSGSELGCSKQITGGKTTLDLKNLKPGSYTFFCSVDSHEQAGMKGTLTVQ